MAGLIIDIETGPIVDAASYLEPASAPSNYKDADKIAAYIAEAGAKQLAGAALDPDLARVVAFGCQDAAGKVDVVLCPDEDAESVMLHQFWRNLDGRQVSLVGFNILQFDLPVLLRRSLYLGVKAPQIQIDKYRHPTVIDLMMLLSYNGALKYRSLSFYAARFGLLHDGSLTGADMPALVAAGDWAGIERHLRADLGTTAALAKRMGVL